MESSPNGTRPKFKLGRLVATPAALELLQGEGREPMEFVARHVKETGATSVSTTDWPTKQPSSMEAAYCRPTSSSAMNECGYLPKGIDPPPRFYLPSDY